LLPWSNSRSWASLPGLGKQRSEVRDQNFDL
jgi:hypothetical protein